jgi:hypothetical protein
MPTLLILSSNPRRDLNLDREISDLTTAVQRLGKFEIRLGLGVSAQELPELLAEHSPQIVHFCGHGAADRGLVFQDEHGREQLVSTEVLARIFKTSILGLIFGLKYGEAARIQHFILRQILHRKNRMPWNYAKFLDFAADRLLLKKIGGSYIFFHRMLLEHFAQKVEAAPPSGQRQIRQEIRETVTSR